VFPYLGWVDRAIEIAKRAGADLKIAAKVDKADQAYFEEVIRPLLSDPRVEFIGEIDDDEKQAFLAGARALLFPIDWPEPFGLVAIEAMACGTPVIAWPHGAVPEIVEDGVTGLIVEGIDEAVAAVERIGSLSRQAVRGGFERRFTVERMAHDYLKVYEFVMTKPRDLIRGVTGLALAMQGRHSAGRAKASQLSTRSGVSPTAEGASL